DAGNVNSAPLLAGPDRADADPARAVGVVLAFAVPRELHLHATVLVGEDLFARLADDHRRLRAVDHRLGRNARRTKGQRDGNATEAVLVMEAFAVAAAIAGGHLGRVMHGGDHVLPVGVEMAF